MKVEPVSSNDQSESSIPERSLKKKKIIRKGLVYFGNSGTFLLYIMLNLDPLHVYLINGLAQFL